MKKKLLLILTLIAVVAMAVVGLAACDDENKELNLDGTYVDEGREAYSLVISGNKISYIFDSSNDNLDQKQDGTFTLSDKTLTVTGIEDFSKLTINSDNNIVWNGAKEHVFVKQN